MPTCCATTRNSNDPQISKLIGTTKPTINAIRDRSHWNSGQIQPRDPVTLGLCRQMDLDEAVEKARKAGRKPADEAPPPTTVDMTPEDEPMTSRVPDWMAGVAPRRRRQQRPLRFS